MKLGYNTLLYSAEELGLALEHISQAGYQGVEVNPKHILARPLSETKKDLQNFDLEICCIMTGWLESKKDLSPIREVIQAAKELKVSTLGVLPPRRNKISWEEFSRLLQKVMKVTSKDNLNLTLHHHGGCLVESPAETGKILKEVPGLGLLFDTAHWWPYGDIFTGLDQFQKRINYVHLKDINPPWGFEKMVKELSNPPSNVDAVVNYFRSFTDLGKGKIDFKKVIETLKPFYDGWLTVEIENDRMPRKEHAQYNMDYLKSLKLEF